MKGNGVSRETDSQQNLCPRFLSEPQGKWRGMLLAASAVLTACAGPSTPPALLSLDPIQPAADERFDGVQVITHGITTLALCRKPPAWIVSYGNSNSSGGGFLGGQAKSAADDVDPSGLRELPLMFLVVPNGQPIKLEGIVRLRSPASGDTRDIPLQASNFKLEPADRCD